jgi:hypothetical protein
MLGIPGVEPPRPLQIDFLKRCAMGFARWRPNCAERTEGRSSADARVPIEEGSPQ